MENLNPKLLKDMYMLLFNEITDTIEELDSIKQKLVEIQQKAEKMFIENDTEM